MLEAFNIAATGMHSHQMNVDVIANNLANANTPGFKKSKVEFEDLMYRQAAAASGLLGSADIMNPVGIGSAVSTIGKVFTLGDLKNTQQPLDIAIRGAGFIEVVLPDGNNAYTRTGSLRLDKDGMLVTADGYPVSSMIQIPSDAQNVQVQEDGTVLAQFAGEQKATELGTIELANVINPDGLTPMGDNLYVPSHASGDVYYGEPGQEGMGTLAQGFLEGSNVDLVEEMTNLVLAQRGYEINAKVLQAADDMLGIVNGLRR